MLHSLYAFTFNFRLLTFNCLSAITANDFSRNANLSTANANANANRPNQKTEHSKMLRFYRLTTIINE
jgi:hypothetical protein